MRNRTRNHAVDRTYGPYNCLPRNSKRDAQISQQTSVSRCIEVQVVMGRLGGGEQFLWTCNPCAFGRAGD